MNRLIHCNNLPKSLKETHDYVVRATENGSSWDNYHNSKKIRRLIDLYFQKVNEFIFSKGKTANPKQVKQSKVSPKLKRSETKTKTVKKVKSKSPDESMNLMMMKCQRKGRTYWRGG